MRIAGYPGPGRLLFVALSTLACHARAADEGPITRSQPPVAQARAQEASPDQLVGPSAFCKREPRLSHGAVVVEWQAEDKVRRLSVDGGGRVLRDGKVVASVSGGCVWGNDGEAVIGANSNGELVGRKGARLGRFVPRTALKIDGDELKVDEVLVLPDGAAKAIASDGSVYLAPRDVPPFSLPAMVTGDVARGRRTAFLLFAFGQPG
jgi:hypothetical protein